MGDAVKTDYAHKETDKIIEELEKKLQKEYQQASKEVEAKMNDYLKRFQTKDKKWREWVANGQKSKAEYIKWRQGQMIVGTRWGNLKEELARDLNNSNQIARKIINNDIKDVYALNMNFSTYQVEKELGINTNFCLYSHDTVERIMKDDPELLPPPGKKVSERIRQGKDVRWNRKTIQSVATQAVLQGESIPAIAHRLAQAVGDSNYKSAIRNARTMCTGAQNAGRVDAHDRLKEIGCQLDEYWLAVHDNRTRTSHRHLDNQKRGDDGFFSNGCRYPADPDCPDGAEIYNCRCTLIAIPRGFEANYNINTEPEIMGMTYDEWKEARPIYKPITKQADTNKAIREQYIKEYKNAPKSKPFHSDKLEKALGKDYNDFRQKVEKSDNKILYERYIESAKSVQQKKGAGCYYPWNKSIEYDYASHEGMDRYSTLAHESGHFFDDKLGRLAGLEFKEIDKVNEACKVASTNIIREVPSASDGFLNSLRKDAEALRESVSDRSIRKEMRNTLENRNATSGVQDFLDGFFSTQKSGLLPWGHGDTYYNRKYNHLVKNFGKEKNLKQALLQLGLDASNQTKVKRLFRIYETGSEAWANISSAVTCGGKELEAIKKYMPNTYKEYLRIIKKVK